MTGNFQLYKAHGAAWCGFSVKRLQSLQNVIIDVFNWSQVAFFNAYLVKVLTTIKEQFANETERL